MRFSRSDCDQGCIDNHLNAWCNMVMPNSFRAKIAEAQCGRLVGKGPNVSGAVGVLMKQTKAYQLQVQQRTLWVRANGVSTLLVAADYQKDFKAAAKVLLGDDWAVVVDMRLWQVSPQQVFDLFKAVVSWSYANGLKQVEVIKPADPLLLWQYLKATDVQQPADVVRNFVDDEETARLHLQAAGYLTEKT